MENIRVDIFYFVKLDNRRQRKSDVRVNWPFSILEKRKGLEIYKGRQANLFVTVSASSFSDPSTSEPDITISNWKYKYKYKFKYN